MDNGESGFDNIEGLWEITTNEGIRCQITHTTHKNRPWWKITIQDSFDTSELDWVHSKSFHQDPLMGISSSGNSISSSVY